MAEAVQASYASDDSYLGFLKSGELNDSSVSPTFPDVEGIIVAAKEMLASGQVPPGLGRENVEPGSPHAVALAIASICGYDAPPTSSTHVKVENTVDDTLGIQQEVIRRVDGVLDNPVLTLGEERQRLQELRDQSKIGTRMFRTLYLAVLQKRRMLARSALIPEITQ